MRNRDLSRLTSSYPAIAPMRPQQYGLSILCLLLAIAGGCGSHTDLTQTLEVQRSGVLGQWYLVRRESDLIKDKPSDTLQIVATDYPAWPRNFRVGKVQAGTRVVVCRVVRITELAAFMVLPVYYTHECVMGMVLDGPYAGKEVNVSGRLGDDGNMLVPTTRPSAAASPATG